MKFPKNRADLYVVIRVNSGGTSILGSFSELAAAEDYRGACEQEWNEKTNYALAWFLITLTTFYG